MLYVNKNFFIVIVYTLVCLSTSKQSTANDCIFQYIKTDWYTALRVCESANKFLLCYSSKHEIDSILRKESLSVYDASEIEIWMSQRRCSMSVKSERSEECLSLMTPKYGRPIFHYFQINCNRQLLFICCTNGVPYIMTSTPSKTEETTPSTSITSTKTQTSTEFISTSYSKPKVINTTPFQTTYSYTHTNSKHDRLFTDPSTHFLSSSTVSESSTTSRSTQIIQETTEEMFSSSRVGCDCGRQTVACKYGRDGEKKCLCVNGYSQVGNICADCSCGYHSTGCYFDKNQKKECLCNMGYEQRNGICSAICNIECVNGKCEIFGDKYSCRCYEGFTGTRCEIQLSYFKDNIYLMVIAIIIVTTSVIIIFWMVYSTSFLCRMKKIIAKHENQ